MGRFMMANTGARKPTNPSGYIGKKDTIQKTFKCMYCETENSVYVTIKKKDKEGSLKCNKCLRGFSCTITHLDEAVDVYFKWVEAVEEQANKEIEAEREKAKEKERTQVRRMERSILKKNDTNVETPKPINRKRKAEDDAPESDTIVVKIKRSKPNDIFAEQHTNLTKIVSTVPGTVELHHTSSANEQARQERNLQAAIELNRNGKLLAMETDIRKKAALAKDRREAKAREWARIEQEESRRWKVVIADAIAASIVMRRNRSIIPPSDGFPAQKTLTEVPKTKTASTAQVPVPSTTLDNGTNMPQPRKTEAIDVESMTLNEASDIYDKLFGSSSESEPDTGSANSIFDIPIPRRSPRSISNNSDQQAVSTVMVEFAEPCEMTEMVRKASYDSLFGSSLSEHGTDEVVDGRRDSLDSLFGSED